GIGQVVVLQRKQNVLPHDILIGVVQNLLRRLGQQPVPELLLFRKHLLVKGGVPLFIGHLSASFLCCLFGADFSTAAAFSPARTDGRCPSLRSSSSASDMSCSDSGRPSMFSKVSSSARRADFSASSASLGKGFSTSTCAASRCWYKVCSWFSARAMRSGKLSSALSRRVRLPRASVPRGTK